MVETTYQFNLTEDEAEELANNEERWLVLHEANGYNKTIILSYRTVLDSSVRQQYDTRDSVDTAWPWNYLEEVGDTFEPSLPIVSYTVNVVEDSDVYAHEVVDSNLTTERNELPHFDITVAELEHFDEVDNSWLVLEDKEFGKLLVISGVGNAKPNKYNLLSNNPDDKLVNGVTPMWHGFAVDESYDELVGETIVDNTFIIDVVESAEDISKSYYYDANEAYRSFIDEKEDEVEDYDTDDTFINEDLNTYYEFDGTISNVHVYDTALNGIVDTSEAADMLFERFKESYGDERNFCQEVLHTLGYNIEKEYKLVEK